MNKGRHRNRAGWLFIAVSLTVAALLRFPGLGAESFWIDEVFSARIVEGPIGEILDRIPPDKPPLDYYLQAVLSPLGEAEYWHRLPAAVAGMIAVVGCGVLGRVLGGRRVGMAALAIAAASPMLVYYSREARPYSLFAAFVAWQTALFFLWPRFQRMPARRSLRWAALCLLLLVTVGMIYTLYAGFIVLGVELAWCVARALSGGWRGPAAARRWHQLGWFSLVAGCAVLASMPLRGRAELYVGEDYFWKFEGISRGLVLDVFQAFLMHRPWSALGPATGILSILMLAGGLLVLARPRFWNSIFLCLLTPVCGVGLLLLYEHIDRSYQVRYSIFAMPGAVVLYAALLAGITGVVAARAGRAAGSAALVALLLVYTSVSAMVHLDGRPYRRGWRDAVRHVAQSAAPNDRVVVPSAFEEVVVEYYLRRFDRADLPLQYQTDITTGFYEGTTWMLTMEGSPDRFRSTGFTGVLVQRQSGTTPSEDPATIRAELPEGGRLLPLGHAPESTLGTGWSAPEDWGGPHPVRWAMGQASLILLPLEAPADGTFVARLHPYSWEGAPDQRVRLRVNGNDLGEASVPQGGFHEPRWTATAAQLRTGWNFLEFEFALHRSPSRDKTNYGDFRELAAAFEWVRWEPATEPE